MYVLRGRKGMGSECDEEEGGGGGEEQHLGEYDYVCVCAGTMRTALVGKRPPNHTLHLRGCRELHISASLGCRHGVRTSAALRIPGGLAREKV